MYFFEEIQQRATNKFLTWIMQLRFFENVVFFLLLRKIAQKAYINAEINFFNYEIE